MFGAGGRAGGAANTAALRRNHQVTAVVRAPGRRPADLARCITYDDFEVALIDEIENPVHHRMHLGVEAG